MPDGRDLSGESVEGLLAGYAAILTELRGRGVVRTSNAPAGDYAEWLVARALGGQIAPSRSAKSWDVRLADGELLQVKCRLVSDPPAAGQLQTSPFRSWDFDRAALVMLDAASYRVRQAILLPAAVVQQAGSWRKHVNGTVLLMRPTLMTHPDAVDITEPLRQAACATGTF